MSLKNDSYIVSSALREKFIKFQDKKFLFVEPGGNCGDFLIYLGAEKLANLCGLNFVRINFDEFMLKQFSDEYVIYIHGGGGINRYCSGKAIELILSAIINHPGPVIVGPHSCEADETFLNEKYFGKFKDIHSENKIFFAREMTTYKIYEKLLPVGFELFHDHDTAFNLTNDDFDLDAKEKKIKAFFIREDKEFSAKKNYKYFGLCIDPAIHCDEFNSWVKAHSIAKIIITNRTHSSILGAILGKNVVLLPNIYHKNKSIWEYSLKQLGVQWSEEVPLGPIEKVILNFKITQKILNSWKFQKFLNEKYYGV